MQSLLKLSRGIDAFTRWMGKRLAWLILVAVVVSALNAIVRKTFDTSSNSWLELQWVLFSIVFLLCSSWTLLDNEHIRIDIVNNMMPKQVRNSIDIIGHASFSLLQSSSTTFIKNFCAFTRRVNRTRSRSARPPHPQS